MMNFRKEQFEIYQKGQAECGMKLGDVTTLNLTALKVLSELTTSTHRAQSGLTSDGGKTFQLNVVPGEAEAGFDIRIPPTGMKTVNLSHIVLQ